MPDRTHTAERPLIGESELTASGGGVVFRKSPDTRKRARACPTLRTRAATRYFFDYELPKIDAWFGVVATRNATCRDMTDECFSQ
jgi:hypothetical protein